MSPRFGRASRRTRFRRRRTCSVSGHGCRLNSGAPRSPPSSTACSSDPAGRTTTAESRSAPPAPGPTRCPAPETNTPPSAPTHTDASGSDPTNDHWPFAAPAVQLPDCNVDRPARLAPIRRSQSTTSTRRSVAESRRRDERGAPPPRPAPGRRSASPSGLGPAPTRTTGEGPIFNRRWGSTFDRP